MPDINQTLLTQQTQAKELREAQLAAQNAAAETGANGPVISISDAATAKNMTPQTGTQETTEETEEQIRAEFQTEQLAAQNRAAAKEETETDATSQIKSGVDQVRQIQQAVKAAQGTARAVNFGSAATLIGLIITFILMNLQLFFGNLMGVSWIPKLETLEIVLIGIVDLLLLLILILIVGLVGAIFNCGSGILEALKCATG